jgi:small conductance mechanosensitive channel
MRLLVMLNSVLSYEIYNGIALGDVLTVEFLVALGGSVVSALMMAIAGFLIAGWVSRRIRKLGARFDTLDNTLFSFLGNISRYAIIVFTALFILNTFGIQTASVVTIIGAASLAIGLALQGTLSNIAAGVMIVFFRPFKLGDFVEIAGKMGTVQDISLNFTELADLSNVQVIVPNAQVWGNIITNYSTNGLRRAEWTFGVSYDTNLKSAEEIIFKTIMADERSLLDPEPFIQVNKLGDFSVDFLVRVWVYSTEYFTYQADMKRKVKEAFDEAGIEIPFPTRTTHNLSN